MSCTVTASSVSGYRSFGTKSPYGLINSSYSDVPGGLPRDDLSLYSTRGALIQLFGFIADWDGCGSAKPSAKAVVNALRCVEEWHEQALSSGYTWAAPHVTASEDGTVVFEWWMNAKKLTLYINDVSVEYIKVWGADIDSEMQDGVIVGLAFQGLWRWINA